MTTSERLDRLPLGRFHYRLLLLSGLGWLFDSMDTGLVSFVLARLKVEWQLGPDQVAAIGSAGLAGMFLGGALAGSCADRFGRKAIFQTTLLIFSIATGLCALAQGFYSLLLLRLLVGFGLGGELPVAAALVSEFAPARHRGRLVVLLESFWAFGWAAAAIIADLLARWADARGAGFPWRFAFAIGALPALYVFILRRALPESPRYLASRGRAAEAEAILRAVEAQSGVAPGGAARGPETGLPKDAATPPARFLDLFAAGVRRRTTMLWILWFAMAYSYYGIFIWLPALLVGQGFPVVQSFRFTLVITLAQVPGYFAAAWLVERIGRKATLVPFMLGCAAASFFFGSARDPGTLVLWGCLVSFFNLGAWGVAYGYTPELYPTRLRGTGTGFAAAFGRIGGILAPLMVGRLMGAWGGGFHAVFIMFAAVLVAGAAGVLLLGEETKGRTLEQISG
ncbi:MAG: MFS transporter [Candidatus Polarisedimenticolia bacterium]